MAKKMKAVPKSKKQKVMKKVMGKFKSKTLKSGSKKGPMVKKASQAKAIGMSEARKGCY